MSGPRCFPLAAVVGQPLVVEALLLLAVDPGLGGVVIAGRRGSGKSVLARGLQELLPPIRVIQGSCCQADPACPSDWDDATIARRALLSRNPATLPERPPLSVQQLGSQRMSLGLPLLPLLLLNPLLTTQPAAPAAEALVQPEASSVADAVAIQPDETAEQAERTDLDQ